MEKNAEKEKARKNAFLFLKSLTKDMEINGRPEKEDYHQIWHIVEQ